MKVLLINHFPLEGSGSGTYTKNIALHLRKRGHEVCVIFPENRPVLMLPGIRIFPVMFSTGKASWSSLPFNFPCFTTHPQSRTTFADLSSGELAQYLTLFSSVLRQAVREFQPDVIHAQHAWCLSWLASLCDIPLVVTIHGTDLMGCRKWPVFRGFAEEAIAGSAKVLAISQDNRDLAISVLPSCANRLLLLPNGYNEDIFYPEEVDRESLFDSLGLPYRGEYIVLFAGKLAEFKGVDTLLLAEHRIDWLMGIADRFLYLRDGRIAAEYAPEDLLLLPEADILGMGLRSPHEGKSLPAPSVSDESPAVLRTAGLSKRIRREVIFDDIFLSFPKGKVTAITGQNGAGKTTLAQILCGLARQTRGHILIDGKKARAAVRRREIYYCGNDTSTQFFTASVAEELLLNTELTEESKDRARHLLKEFGLYEYRDTHPSTLSGGQKQRLAIACAIFSGRGILILDEPTSGLDGQNMRLVAERLRSEARNGRTILVITHDRELIKSCCDNVVEVGTKPSEVQ